MLSFSFINVIRLILRAVCTCEWRLKGFNYLYQNIYMSGNKAIILKDYEFCQQNGNFVQINYGSYGSVRLAKCMKTGTIVAIKTIYGILVKREIQNHIEMSHKNVIKLIDYFIDEINISTWLIFQYPENGKLFHYFRTIKVLERALVYSILRTICEALEYLYYNGILLRQFNPDYIYINKKNNIKICGLEFDDTPEQKIHRKIPLEYMAPQLFKNQHFDQKIYSWGLGVIFYELVEGKTPFKANNFNQLMTQIQKPFNLTNFRFEQMELINKTLKLDPKQRFRLNELLTKTILNQAFTQCLGKSGYIIKNSQIKVAQKHMQSKIKITQSLKGQDRAKRSQKKQVKHGIESRIKITQISQISECPEQAENLKVNMSQGEIVGNNTAQTTKNSIQIIGINNLEFNETSNIQITGIKNTMDPNKSSHLIPVNPGTLGQTTNIFDKLREQKKCLLAIGQSKQKISLRQLKIKKQDFKLVKPT